MNEKITLQDLINLFSEKQGMNKKDAEVFVRTMFELIEEALATEKYVKIKGFGTFKLTEVDSRESVNVNTGERIEIQGHTKISFTPDATMKDLINKPFSHFETVILNEGVELEDTPVETSEEIVQEEIISETILTEEPAIMEEPQPEPLVETPIEEGTIVEEPTVEEQTIEEPISEEPIEEETIVEEPIVEESTIEEPVAEQPITEEPVITEIPTSEEKQTEEPVVEKQEETEKYVSTEEKKVKNTNRILWGVIVVLVLIILFGAYWMFLRPSSVPEVTPLPPVQEEVTIPVPTEEKQPEDTIETVKFIQLSAEELRKEHVPSFADTLDYQIIGTQEEYTLQKGETIIRASVKFFGTKKYWPYIVKHNLDVLPDPDNIPAGVKIKIPVLTPKK
jgi:nucleoid DNA-binding protein